MKSLKATAALILFGLGLSAHATPGSVIQVEDLKSVDKFDCHIEVRGENTLRILSTPLSSDPGFYVDLRLDDAAYTVKDRGEGSWNLEKEIDLAEESGGARLFPRLLYGREITKISFSKRENGKDVLRVSYTPSTMSIGSTRSFSCNAAPGIGLDKRSECPTCVSSQ